MAYNHQKEELKWKSKKRKEELILRNLRTPESIIKELYEYDRIDFNRDRKYKENEITTQENYFVCKPTYDQIFIISVEDLLNQIENDSLLYKLKKSNSILLKILLLRFLEYDINEIALELNMTPNAVRKRINKFKKIIIWRLILIIIYGS